jgi:predicted nucleic acid-binding protein
MAGESFLVDTNILLRLVQPDSPDHAVIRQSTDLLWLRGCQLFYASQNLAEFWNVCTRPAERNGFGFSVLETNVRAELIESKLALASESEASHREWRRIVVADAVSGVQVHDARLVAVMRVHRLRNLLTLNVRDFRRFGDIVALSPEEILVGRS